MASYGAVACSSAMVIAKWSSQLDQTMDVGGMGKYLMFKRPQGHGMIGGIMNKPKEMANVAPN